MPDHPGNDDFDLDDVLASVVIEPDEQFEQRLKMRLRKRLAESKLHTSDTLPSSDPLHRSDLLSQKPASNGSHNPIRQVNPKIQENNPMKDLIKSLFIRSGDTPRRSWAFGLLALGAVVAVAIMAFVLGSGRPQVIVGSNGQQEAATSEPTDAPTEAPTATSTPEPTATERPTERPTEERPTERATHENRTPEGTGPSIEEASAVAGFAVLDFASVPEGYELVRRNADPNLVMTIYSLVDGEGGRELWFTQASPAEPLRASERAVEVTVNGNQAFFRPQDDREHSYNELVWNQGDFTFVMGALNLTQEEMIALAESLQ